MNLYIIFTISTLLIFCGCQSRKTVPFASTKPASASLMHDQSAGAARPGFDAGLREAGSLEVFGMNRYVDPADHRIMHERHAIYRLEQQPGWLLGPPR